MNQESCSKKLYQSVISCQLANGYKIDFSNNFIVKQVTESSMPVTTIRNVVCKKIGNLFKKITQITVGSKVITIEDTYEFIKEPEDQYSTQSSISPTCEAESKDQKGEDESEFAQRLNDRKNVVKNIVKSFQRKLKQSVPLDPSSIDASRVLNYMLRRNKFNNKLISKLVICPSIKLHFQRFLQTDANQWLANSKIVDKETTMQTIRLYLNLYQESGIARLPTARHTKY